MARKNNNTRVAEIEKPKEILSLKPSIAGASIDLRELWRRLPSQARGVASIVLVIGVVSGAAGWAWLERSDLLWQSTATMSKDRDQIRDRKFEQAREIDTLRNELSALKAARNVGNEAVPTAINIAPGAIVEGYEISGNTVRGGSLLGVGGALKDGKVSGNNIDTKR